MRRLPHYYDYRVHFGVAVREGLILTAMARRYVKQRSERLLH